MSEFHAVSEDPSGVMSKKTIRLWQRLSAREFIWLEKMLEMLMIPRIVILSEDFLVLVPVLVLLHLYVYTQTHFLR